MPSWMFKDNDNDSIYWLVKNNTIVCGQYNTDKDRKR